MVDRSAGSLLLSEHVHGTAIARGNDGVLLLGPSASGKSDLALRCLSMAIAYPPGPPFQLVSDDQTLLKHTNNAIEMIPPATIAGRLEVRGLGIVALPFRQCAHLQLIVRLTNQPTELERIPCSADLVEHFHNRLIKRIWLNPFESSAPAKVALALHTATSCEKS